MLPIKPACARDLRKSGLTRLADRLGQDHAQQEFQSALTSLLDRISRLSANPPEQ